MKSIVATCRYKFKRTGLKSRDKPGMPGVINRLGKNGIEAVLLDVTLKIMTAPEITLSHDRIIYTG